MWIFTREGFFSVTDNRRDETTKTVMVRARVKDDLIRLIEQIADQTEEPSIIETPTADYRYRIVIPRKVWGEYLRLAAMTLDYTNVKGTLAPTDPRHTAMRKCWDARGALQPGGPYGQDNRRAWGGSVGDSALYDDIKGKTSAPSRGPASKAGKRTSKVVVSQGKGKRKQPKKK